MKISASDLVGFLAASHRSLQISTRAYYTHNKRARKISRMPLILACRAA